MRYFLDIAYKGTQYHGWQLQPNARTIQEEIEKALSILTKSEVSISGAGRTDAGVHAEQLFAHFDLPNEIEVISQMCHSLNGLLPIDIVIRDIFQVKSNAHARFDAIERTYEYRIYLGRNPFFLDTAHQLLNRKLNSVKMNEACEFLLSYTDFKSFSRSNTDVKTYDCDIVTAKWLQQDEWLIFTISANRFLRNMVRAIVGTMIDIGSGKTSLNEFEAIIKSKDRTKAGASAPAKGLFLTAVTYPKTIYK